MKLLAIIIMFWELKCPETYYVKNQEMKAIMANNLFN